MTTFLAFLFVLFILVFFHELGHFLAARSVGVRVEKFYVGFNIFGLGIKRKYGDTEYGLGLLPLGGYVKLAGAIEESMDTEITGASWELQSKSYDMSLDATVIDPRWTERKKAPTSCRGFLVGWYRSLYAMGFATSLACNPLGPSKTSNSTVWPSINVLNPSPLIAE